MSDLVRIFDRHGGGVYALALRITDDAGQAAEVTEEVFASLAGSQAGDAEPSEAWLLLQTRELALARREGQTAPRAVVRSDASPQALVEAAFFEGAGVADLARSTGLAVNEVRRRLHDGMAVWRGKLGSRDSR